MKLLIAVTCLLATTTVVRGIDQNAIIPKYMEYLMPDIEPCANEFSIDQDHATHIQQAPKNSEDARQLGCMKACVMKRMSILTGGTTDFHVEPIYKMIEKVHAGNDAEIQEVKNIADACTESIKGMTDECELGNKYTECYIEKLFN